MMQTPRMLKYMYKINDVRFGIYRKEGDAPAVCVEAIPEGFPCPPEEILALTADAMENGTPLLASVRRTEYYALFPEGDTVVVMGPVNLSTVMELKHEFSEAEVSETCSYNPLLDGPVYLEMVKMLAEWCTGRHWSQDELIEINIEKTSTDDINQQVSSKLYKDREMNVYHNSYSHEVRMLSSIEQGDPEILSNDQSEESGGKLGMMAPTLERSARNVCICVIALMSRAAIRGGLHPEVGFTLCDTYVMKIEKMQNLVELSSLMHGAQHNFASMVRTIKEAKHRTDSQEGPQLKHPLVERCKNYVHKHLHGRVSLGDAAAALNTSPKYLSSLFKRIEGITFCDYVIREKVEVAKQMLLYSQLSYGEISATLGFSSQSHMGKCFRQWTGLTPIQYRKQFEITEI